MRYIVLGFAIVFSTLVVIASKGVANTGYIKLIDDKWTVVALGWSGALRYGVYWLAAGVTIGSVFGYLLGSHVWEVFQASRDDETERLREKASTELAAARRLQTEVAMERSRADVTIQSGITSGLEAYHTKLSKEQASRRRAEQQVQQLEKKLKDSQGKAQRIAKKAVKNATDEP